MKRIFQYAAIIIFASTTLTGCVAWPSAVLLGLVASQGGDSGGGDNSWVLLLAGGGGLTAVDTSVSLDEDSSYTIDLSTLVSGASGTVSYTIVNDPSNGTLSSGSGKTLILPGSEVKQASEMAPSYATSNASVCSSGSCVYKPTANYNGTDTITYTATDSGSGTTTAEKTITLTINPVADTAGSTSYGDVPSSVTVGSTVSISAPTVSGGTATSYTYSATGLPDGLSIDSTTGAITGTATSACVSPNPCQVTVTATTVDGETSTVTFDLDINDVAPSGLTYATTSTSTTVGSSVSIAAPTTSTGTGTITYTASGLPSGLSIDSSTGAISGTVASSGSYSVTITASNTGGSTTTTMTFTINPSAPGTPDLQTASDTGISSSDDITTDTTPTFDVSCETGNTVTLYVDGTASGSTGTCSSSTVALTSGTLGAGTYSITAKQQNGAGTLSSASSALSITIDVSITASTGTPNLQAASDSGSSSTDDITTDTTPTFDVVCTSGNYVQLYVDGTASGSSGTCASSTVTLTTGTLSDATYSVTAKEYDTAGNYGTTSSSLSVKIDTTAPTLTLTAPANSSSVSDAKVTYNLSEALGSLTITYTGSSGGGSASVSGLASGTNSDVAVGVTLTNGVSYAISYAATDLAGNSKSSSTGTSVTYDSSSKTIALAYSVTSPVKAGSLTITATFEVAPTSTPTINIDQAGTTDISGASMTWTSGATTATYTYTVVTHDGGAYQDGTVTVTIGATPSAGTSFATPSNNTFVTDTQVATPGTPDLQTGSDTGTSTTDNKTNDTTPTFDITCETGATVRLYHTVSNQIGTGTCSGGTVAITSSTLTDGTYSITANQTDSAGNLSSASSALSITIDSSVADTGTPDLQSGSDTGSSTTDNITSSTTPSFDVSCESGATVQLYSDGVATGSTGSCSSSTVSLTASTLSASAHSITAKQTDSFGNTSNASAALSITVDTSVGATGLPDLQTSSDSGSSTTDNITSDTTPTFDVSCETGTTVQIYVDGTASGSSGTCASSTVTLTTATLTDATYTITAKQTDTAGNVSSASSSLSVTIDSTGTSPGVPDLQTASDTGSSSTDNITSATSPVFSVSCETGATVQLYNGTTSIAGASGTCSGSTVSLTAASLSAGSYSINAKQTDAAGNVGGPSSSLSVTIDTTSPSAPGTPDMQSGSDSGTSNSDNITSITAPTFDVSCETGATVQLYVGGTASGSSGTCASSTVSLVTGTLSAGSYNITAKQTDAAGNTSAASSSLSVTIDTSESAPGAPDLVDASDTGTSNSDNITTDSTPTFTVTCNSGDTVQLYDSTTGTGSSATCSSSPVTLTAGTLSEGTHTISAKQIDTAGNLSSASSTLSVTIDLSQAATGTPDLQTGSDTGSSTSDDITKNTSLLFDVSCETDASVQLYVDGTASGSAGTCASSTVTLTSGAVSAGTLSITAKQTDAAGNVSAASSALSVTVDTTAPTLTLTSPTNSSTVSDSKVSYSLSENLGSLSIKYDGTGGASASLSGSDITSGSHTNVDLGLSLTSVNSYAIKYTATDVAGNSSATDTATGVTVSYNTSTYTISLAYSPTSPVKAGTVTITATFGTAPTGTPTIDVDQAGTTDITGANMSGSGTTWTYSYTVNTHTGSTYVDGTATVSITATPGAGGSYGTPSNNTFTIDTQVAAPGTPDLVTAYDTGTSTSDNLTSSTTPQFTVTCEVGSSVQLYKDSVANGSAGTCSSSPVTLTTATLTDGTYSFTAVQTDAAGNVSSASSGLSVTIDTTEAATGTPDLVDGSDSGSSNTDDITSATTPSFTVSCITGSTVQLYSNGVASGSSGSCSSSTVTLTSGTLATGVAYSITAKQTDGAGNTSAASSALSVTIDTTAPAATGTPDLATASDTGTSSSDNLTYSTTPQFTVSCETGASVQLYKDTVANGSAGTCSGSTVTLTAATLTSGTYSFTAKQTDLAGNVSVASSGLSVTIDTSISATGTPDLATASDTGSSSSDNITSATSLTFTVATCENGDSVQLYVDGVASGSAGTCASNTVDLTTGTLSAGTLSITAKQTDTAGNVSSASSALSVTVDTSQTAPGTPDLQTASDTGSSSTDNETSSATPTFDVSCETGTTVQLYDGTTATGSSGTCSGSTVSLTAGTLTTGGHSINAKQTDAAGNTSNASSDLSITVDTGTPSAPASLDLAAADDSGYSDTDNLTKNLGSLTISGTAEAGTTVELFRAGSTSLGSTTADGSGNWTLDVTLVTGSNSVTAKATDTAGNTSAASSALAITVDTTAPVVSSVSSSKTDGTYGVGTLIPVTVTFNETMYVTTTGGTPTLTLETGATDSTVSYSSGSASTVLTFNYTVASGNTSSDLDYTDTGALVLNSGTIQDGAGNSAVLTLATPGNTGSLGANKALVIDGTAPTITAVSADAGYNTSHKEGSVILVKVTFNESVTVDTAGGTPYMVLETGTNDRNATYQSGSGSTILVFTYTVQSGDTSADLDYTSTSALSTNGGTIKDTAGNSATLTLSSPGSAGSLAYNNSIVVDTTAPFISSITSSTANATYGIGATINVTVNMSEAVTLVTGPLTVTLETGTTDRTVSVSAGSYPASALTGTYTVQSGDASSDLTANSVALGGGTLRDAAGNDATLTLPAGNNIADNKAIVISTSTASITSITSSTGDGTYGPSSSINVTVTFSESVTLSGASTGLRVTLDTGATVDIGNFVGTTATGTYTVGATGSSQNSSDLDSTNISLVDGTLVTTSGSNPVTVAVPTTTIKTGSAIVVDTTAPTISSLTSSTADGTYGASSTINVTVNMSEAVTLVTGPLTVTLETGTTDRTVNVTGSYPATSLTGTYTVQSGDTSSDLTANSVALGGGTLRDAAGNDATLTLPAGNNIADSKAIVVNTSAVEASFAASSSSVAENVGTVSVQVNLSATATSDTAITYSVGGTATSGTDFTALSGTVTVTTGNSSANISIPITSDTLDENDETIILTLTGGATIVSPSTYTLTITDDDDPPQIYFALSSSATVDETAGTHNITVSLSAVSGKDVSVTFTTSGTATSGTDYSGLTSSPLTITAGNSSGTISFTVTSDAVDEGSGETVILTMGTPTNATLGSITTHTATITDDDGMPTISVLDASITEGDSGTSTVTIYVDLAGSDASAIGVDYTTVNGSAVAGTCGSTGVDYQSTSGTLSWSGGDSSQKTFTVTVCGETIAETNETFSITLSNVTGNATIADGSATVTITNNDTTLSITSAETLDCDPVDGLLDHYKITFSAAVTDSTFGGYVANSEGYTNSSWGIAGRSNVRLDHGTALASACGTDTANDTVIYLKFDPSSTADTGVKPELTATASTVSNSSAGKLYYNTGNIATTDVSETDKAGPVIVYALATEGGAAENGVGPGDTLQVRYSESTNAASLSGVDLDTIITLDNSHNFGSSTDITSTAWSQTTYSNDTLTITFATTTPTVYDGDTVTATGTTVKDTSAATNAPPSSVPSPAAILPTFDSGAAGPTVTAVEYRDTDSNGFIDHAKVTFSKNVNDSTFPGYNAGSGSNGVHDVTTAWQVSGYSNVRLDTSDTLDTGDNDTVIWIKFAEGSDYDTDAKPDLTATLASAGLRDAVDTCYLNTSPTNCLNSSYAVLLTTHVAETDAAPPIITYSSARVGDRYIFLKFSEGVYGSTGAPACGSGGEVKAADFSYSDVSADSVSAISSVDTTANCASSTAYARLFANANFASTDIDTDKVGAAASEVYDAANNAMSSTLYTIRATVAPYLITASSYYSGGKYYLRVVYSESMDYTTATNAANYTLSEDVSTACSDISSIPLSVTALSSTIYDLETTAQCGVGSANPTTYKIVASSSILDENEIEGVTNPNTVTTMGTSSTDATKPKLIQALSKSSTTVQITFSEPMKSGDQSGSSTCESTYVTGVKCGDDVDGITGTQLKYTFTPSLGTVSSVVATADPSVYIITHSDIQLGAFYNITAYSSNTVAGIPEDLSGNDLEGTPLNQATFKGQGSIIDDLTDGALFDDPFADNSKFAYAFTYSGKVYLGPNDSNTGAFRFEPDAANPTTVTFSATGTCTSTTFGIQGDSTCGTDLGPNSETGVVGFNSGTASISGTDYEILTVGPLKSAISHVYFTQDIDNQLNFSGCSLGGLAAGANIESAQSMYVKGSNIFVGITSSHSTEKPVWVKVPLTATGGIVSCSTGTELNSIQSDTYFGPSGKDQKGGGYIGVDSMLNIANGSGLNPTGHSTDVLWLTSWGGLAYSTDDGATLTNVLHHKMYDNNQCLNESKIAYTASTTASSTTFSGQTLGISSIGKVRPGQKGIPFLVTYKNELYMARNLTTGCASTNQTGGELWKCSSNCGTSTNWSKVASITSFSGGSSNLAISMLIVNGDYLYLGTDNSANGVGVYRASASVTSEASFTQMGPSGNEYGLGLGASVAPYIFSSATANKQGLNYLYITVGPSTDAIKVLTQHD